MGAASAGADERRERLAVGRTRDSLLGDDGGDVLGRRDVEGRVADARAFRRHAIAAHVRHFAVVALLDRDAGSVGGPQVDGGERRGDVERNAVLLGEDGHAVGADLVGHVAVGGDAIGADDHQVDARQAHHRRGHVVGDDRGVDPVLDQLPGREPRALQERPRLVGEHRHLLAAFGGGADDAERGAVAGRGQRPGVAVGEDAGLLRARASRRARPWRGSSPRLRRGYGGPPPRGRA